MKTSPTVTRDLATRPPTIWPWGSGREIEKSLGTGKDVVPRKKVAEMERMSNRP
jgi:hypothetical protein